jgi:MFS family permease
VSESTSEQSIRGFWSALPVEGRWLLATVAVQTLGRGLTLPFTVIYLHEVRGITLDLAGLLMAFIAVVALAVTGPAGALTDRFGARILLLWSTTAQLVGCVIVAFASTPLVFAVGFLFMGINFGVGWPAFNALVAAIVSGPARQQYFGINFALVNLGIGVGGIVGGIYADVGRPVTFTMIFLGDAASMLVPIGLLLGPLRHVHGRAERPADAPAQEGTYATILRNPAVVWLTVLTFLGVFVGYGQMEAGFPAFARQVSEVSTRVIGFAFAVNTLVIVLLQFAVLKRISGHRRTRVLIVMAGIWAGSWVILGLTGLTPATVLASVGVLTFHAFFALGETLLQPTVPAITNDLAPDHLRGRYNAVNAGAFQAGTILGPVVAGFMLRHDWSTAFIVMIVVGCAFIGVLALALERRITPEVNGIESPVSTVGTEGTEGREGTVGTESVAGPERPSGAALSERRD